MMKVIRGSRAATAMLYGVWDARTAVRFYETHGLSLADQTMMVKKRGLVMDWKMCLHELQMIGMDESSAMAMVEEAKFCA